MIIVDATVWIDHFNGQNTPQVRLLHHAVGAQELGVGDLIVCEVLQGFRNDRDYRTARQALRAFPVFDMVGGELAEQAADNYRTLRKRGITVRKTIDVLIATFVLARGFRLLHSDRDFDPFEHELGLQVVHPGTEGGEPP